MSDLMPTRLGDVWLCDTAQLEEAMFSQALGVVRIVTFSNLKFTYCKPGTRFRHRHRRHRHRRYRHCHHCTVTGELEILEYWVG